MPDYHVTDHTKLSPYLGYVVAVSWMGYEFELAQQNGTTANAGWKERAGKRLGITQEGATEALQRIEIWWGQPLFVYDPPPTRSASLIASDFTEHGVVVVGTFQKLVGGWDITQYTHRGLLQHMRIAAKTLLQKSDWIAETPPESPSFKRFLFGRTRMRDFLILHDCLHSMPIKSLARTWNMKCSVSVPRAARRVEAVLGAHLVERGPISRDDLQEAALQPTAIGKTLHYVLDQWTKEWYKLLSIRQDVNAPRKPRNGVVIAGAKSKFLLDALPPENWWSTSK